VKGGLRVDDLRLVALHKDFQGEMIEFVKKRSNLWEVSKMIKRFLILFLVIFALSGHVFIDVDWALAAEKPLPKMFVWTSLRLGSLGHSQSMGFAEAVKKVSGVPVRIVPAAADMAGFLPLRAGEVHFCYRGGTDNLSCGLGEAFASEAWGPQPVRVVWAVPLLIGFATRKDTGIKTYADIKGKRFPDYKGWEPGELITAAILAAYDLTWKDVVAVPTAGYVDGIKGLIDGKLDIADVAPESSLAREVESKSGGIVWVESPRDPERIKKWLKMAPYFTPGWMDRGAGLSPQNPCWGTVFRYLLISYDHLDPEIAYVTTKALWEGYDIYKDLHPSLKYATREIALDYKSLTHPYHEGSVKFFKDIGVWTSDMEEWQKNQLAFDEKRKNAWEEAKKAAAKKKIKLSAPEWYSIVDGIWVEWLRENNLLSIPKIEYHEYKK